MFEDAVRKKADQLGLPPQTVLRNFIKADLPEVQREVPTRPLPGLGG
jgi:hypothetical protein